MCVCVCVCADLCVCACMCVVCACVRVCVCLLGEHSEACVWWCACVCVCVSLCGVRVCGACVCGVSRGQASRSPPQESTHDGRSAVFGESGGEPECKAPFFVHLRFTEVQTQGSNRGHGRDHSKRNVDARV